MIKNEIRIRSLHKQCVELDKDIRQAGAIAAKCGLWGGAGVVLSTPCNPSLRDESTPTRNLDESAYC